MKRAFFILYLLSLFAGNARSQDMLTATIANIAVHDFQRERIRSEYEREKSRLDGNRGLNASNSKNTGRTPAFLFDPDTRVSAAVKRSIIDDLKRKNAVSGQHLETALNRDNPFPAYVSYLGNLGLDVQHNYADAFTAYILGMWRIANKQPDPSAGQIRAVRNQVAAAINTDGWTNRKKQEGAEYLLYDLIFANEPYESSRKAGNKARQQQDSDAVYHRFLKKNRMNLRGMTITQKGLVVIK
ncbi:hypothetical protein [Niabella drilacis]|uniref:Uncharacterized protein n=1 Tax=Niabella drilacis (strain DSM 25811 / CCM 8410 / CCUG 62505 / LMG 26954 / E90) TaxID=1285928 RepID=A0A1G6Z7M7_NIADE|nr:hypothetical protein [Niabella drilacis]SDD97875.1 hypothetical protein SAMN04487894_11764 [Niabella drilacis]